MESYNIVSALFEMAKTQPDTLAIAIPAKPGKPLPKSGPIPYHEISFKELADETNCISHGLLASGFKRGDRVVLMVPPGLDFFTLSFAFLQSGIVPVLIDPGIGIKNLKECIGESNPVGFIGISKAQVARVFLGWGKSSIKKKVTIGPRLFWGGKSFKKIKQVGQLAMTKANNTVNCFEPDESDLASILFTSGSTGVPKGVMYSHGNFRHQVEIIRKTFDMEAGEIDLPTFAPFALFNPTVGMSSVIPDMNPTKPASVDPARIIRALEQFKITNMFGSPALIDRVGRYAEANNVKIPTLKRVLSAGAPVPAKTLRRFATMLNPGIEIFTPYGATESMPIACIGSDLLLQDDIQQRSTSGGGICIGNPVHNIEVRIIRISDEPIENWSDELEVNQGDVGEIIVKGPNVTRAYYNRDQATNLAKIKDEDSFWHRMGDLGYKDSQGLLWFCGRKSHHVKLADRELYTIQWESIFNQHPQVYRTALVEVNKKAVLCVELDKDSVNPDQKRVIKDLMESAAKNELPIEAVLFHKSFPVDIRHNAKIFREKLAVWAATQL